MDRCFDPGGWTADLLCSLAFQQRTSQDDFRVSYAGERLRAPWKVSHHWDKWDRMEHEVGKLTFAKTRRCKPLTTPSPLHQDKEAAEEQNNSEEDEQDKEINFQICTYLNCSKPALSFSSFFLSWTVPKLIGHENVFENIFYEILFLNINTSL